jgi:signal transduction histidine kinase
MMPVSEFDMPSSEFDEISRLNNELLNAQRELHVKNRQLESLNTEKNQAMGVLAHDLRNPVGLIQLCTDLLMRDEVKLGQDERELVQMIREASASMARMVNDVLDLTAIESGTLRLKRQTLELSAYVQRNAGRYRILARKNNVEIDFHPAREALMVSIDPDKFEQVLNNLLRNAVSFSPPGGPVEVRVFSEGKDAVIVVRDHGPGIAPADTAKLFRPFVRGPQSGREGASVGLGLAIVKRIVEGHSARIGITSEPGHGATFSIHLQRIDASPHQQHRSTGIATDDTRCTESAKNKPESRMGTNLQGQD